MDKIGNGDRNSMGGRVLQPGLHCHQCRRLGVEDRCRSRGVPGLCRRGYVEMGHANKGKPFLSILILWLLINVDPVLAVSASGLIGKSLLSIIIMDWKPVNIWLHAWPHTCMCIWEEKMYLFNLLLETLVRRLFFFKHGCQNFWAPGGCLPAFLPSFPLFLSLSFCLSHTQP